MLQKFPTRSNTFQQDPTCSNTKHDPTSSNMSQKHVPKSLNMFQHVKNNSKWSKCFNMSQNVSHVATWIMFKHVPKISNMFKHKTCFDKFQHVPKCLNMFWHVQNISRWSKWFNMSQKVSKSFKKFQNISKSYIHLAISIFP